MYVMTARRLEFIQYIRDQTVTVLRWVTKLINNFLLSDFEASLKVVAIGQFYM